MKDKNPILLLLKLWINSDIENHYLIMVCASMYIFYHSLLKIYDNR